MSELAWRFFVWMCEPSKLKIRAWHVFFWITPRWLSKKVQIYMLRLEVERHPGEMERKIRESLPEMERKLREELAPLLKLEAQESGATRSEEELAAASKLLLDLFLHPEAREQLLEQARKRHSSQIGPRP